MDAERPIDIQEAEPIEQQPAPRRSLTRYIVVDFEFNQAFDFVNGKAAPGEWACPEEIIQIGAVKLDDRLQEMDTFNSFIKPQIYKRLHPFVRKVTGITPRMLADAPAFTEAFERFARFIGTRKNTLFCVWGGDDMKAMFRNMMYCKLDCAKLTKRFINVQRVAGAKLGAPGQIALSKAVGAFGIEPNLDFHDALNDALYTADVLRAASDGVDLEEQAQAFDLAALKRAADSNLPGVHMKTLLAYAAARFRRELTEEERIVVSKIYQAGREGKFDVKRDRPDPQAAASAEPAAPPAE